MVCTRLVCMYVCIYACMFVYMYVCMLACMYVCIYICAYRGISDSVHGNVGEPLTEHRRNSATFH
jgi:hypothetical protein